VNGLATALAGKQIRNKRQNLSWGFKAGAWWRLVIGIGFGIGISIVIGASQVR